MTSYADVDDLVYRIQLSPDLASLTPEDLQVLEDLLDAISRKVDRFCHVPDNYFTEASEATYKYYRGTGESSLEIAHCYEISEVAVKDDYLETAYVSWTSPTTMLAGDGDWFPIAGSPEHPIYDKTPYTFILTDPNGDYTYFTESRRGVPTVRVNAYWGYGSTPPDIREAVLAQVTILYKRFQGSMASTLATSDMGSLSLRIRRGQVSRDVRELLEEGGWVRTAYGESPY